MAIGDVIRQMQARERRVVAPPPPPPPVRQRTRQVVIEHTPSAATPPVQTDAVPVVAPPPPSLPAIPAHPPIQRGKPVLGDRHVVRLVAQTDAAPQTSRSGGNADNYIHASSLIGCCEREHCISQQHGLPVASTVAGPMRIIWAIGRAVEKHIRQGVITARDYHGVYGRWECPCEAVSYTGEHVRGRICNRCTKPADRYKEPVLSNDFMRVVGSPDLTLIEQGWYMPVEIKSMNKDQFDKLEAPLADHAIQGCMYRWLYEQLGFPVMDVVPIVYGRKDFKFGGSLACYKEYHVNYADWHGQVEAAMLTGQRIASYNERRSLPDRLSLCASPTSPRAKDCPRVALCFSL